MRFAVWEPPRGGNRGVPLRDAPTLVDIDSQTGMPVTVSSLDMRVVCPWTRRAGSLTTAVPCVAPSTLSRRPRVVPRALRVIPSSAAANILFGLGIDEIEQGDLDYGTYSGGASLGFPTRGRNISSQVPPRTMNPLVTDDDDDNDDDDDDVDDETRRKTERHRRRGGKDTLTLLTFQSQFSSPAHRPKGILQPHVQSVIPGKGKRRGGSVLPLCAVLGSDRSLRILGCGGRQDQPYETVASLTGFPSAPTTMEIMSSSSSSSSSSLESECF